MNISEHEAELIMSAVRDAGKMILSAHDIERDIKVKPGDDNFATVWDSDVQCALLARLTAILPEAAVLAEEDGLDKAPDAEILYIVDPIDGTTNFIHGCRHSAVSVGVVSGGEPVFGCVYNPYLDEMFYARRGCGAYLCRGGSTEKLSVSRRPLYDALVCFGTTPYDKTKARQTFDLVCDIFTKCRDVRRGGSAALDICYVAAGRFDLFFKLSLSPWDFSAASLILREAGGIITDIDGGAIPYADKTSAVASNGICGLK